jgi:hypothetical protein
LEPAANAGEPTTTVRSEPRIDGASDNEASPKPEGQALGEGVEFYDGATQEQAEIVRRHSVSPATRRTQHRRGASQKQALSNLLSGTLGPTACWWHAQEHPRDGQYRLSSTDSDEQTAPQSSADDVRIPMPLLKSNRVAPGPLAEGVHEELAKWLDEGQQTGGSSAGGGGGGGGVVRLPPIAGIGSNQLSSNQQQQQSTHHQHHQDLPMEDEMNEVFGRPFDESRAPSVTEAYDHNRAAASLPHSVPSDHDDGSSYAIGALPRAHRPGDDAGTFLTAPDVEVRHRLGASHRRLVRTSHTHTHTQQQ